MKRNIEQASDIGLEAINKVLGSSVAERGLNPDNLTVQGVIVAAQIESQRQTGGYELPLIDTLVRLSNIREELSRRALTHGDNHGQE